MPDLGWKAPAVADLMAIVDYISDDDPDAAQALMEEIQAKVERLRTHPRLGPPGRVTGTRELVVRPNYIVHRDLCRDPGGGDGAARASRRPDVALTPRPCHVHMYTARARVILQGHENGDQNESHGKGGEQPPDHQPQGGTVRVYAKTGCPRREGNITQTHPESLGGPAKAQGASPTTETAQEKRGSQRRSQRLRETSASSPLQSRLVRRGGEA